MAREHATYDEEIKLSIYQKLNRRPLRFNDLVEALGRNRVTVSEYLLHGQKEDEVDRDPKTKQYHLTEKGKEEIDRILSDRARHKAPLRYHGKVGPGSGAFVEWEAHFPPPSEWSRNSSDYYYDMAVSVSGSPTYGVWTPRLPLPVDLDASLYGTEEFREFFEQDEKFFEKEFHLRSRKSKATILDDSVRPLAEAFFSFFLFQRFFDSMSSHLAYEKRGEVPPLPLTVESVLGFDVSMTIRYQGRDRFLRSGIPSASEAKERHLIMKRLVGALLLRAAYNRDLELGYPYVDLIQTAGWLDKGDAEAINRAYLQWKKEGDQEREIRKPSPDNPLRKLLYQTGWRYLEDGGYRTKAPKGAEL